MKDLNGKNVVVTGGSYGIGEEIARAFLKEGANVFTIARNKEKLDACVEGLQKDARPNRAAKGYAGDVGDWPVISKVIEQIEKTPEVEGQLFLRGNPPVGTCTICVGKKEIGWQSHFGVIRALDNQVFYRGQ